MGTWMSIEFSRLILWIRRKQKKNKNWLNSLQRTLMKPFILLVKNKAGMMEALKRPLCILSLPVLKVIYLVMALCPAHWPAVLMKRRWLSS